MLSVEMRGRAVKALMHCRIRDCSVSFRCFQGRKSLFSQSKALIGLTLHASPAALDSISKRDFKDCAFTLEFGHITTVLH